MYKRILVAVDDSGAHGRHGIEHLLVALGLSMRAMAASSVRRNLR